MVADCTKDTSMDLVQAVMLPNDVATLSDENSKLNKGLLVIHQVHVSVVSLVLFNFCFPYLMFFYFLAW